MKLPATLRLISLLPVLACAAAAVEIPQSVPRATMGDSVVEPDWAERLTITVGPAGADVCGTGQKAIQAAVDYVARLGGGTVKLLPGTYRLRNAVYLQSKVRLVGSGADTVLIKEPSATSGLAQDSDWFDQEITLANPAGFEVGDGVCLESKDSGEALKTMKRTLVARIGNRFKLDRGLRTNFWRAEGAKASTLFPIISGENIDDIDIENLVLDGNRANNANLNGNFAGCIFLQECNRVTIRGVVARNYNGDGISWQVCHDVVVENCTSVGNADLGLHDGSGSQRSIISNNHMRGNHIGLYICWGVRYATARNNDIEANDIGVSIGHHDTDDVFRDNRIADSKTVGFLFRPEHGADFTPRRVTVENNRFVDNGGSSGLVIDVQGGTESVAITGNKILDHSRDLTAATAIRVGPQAKDIAIQDNRFGR